MMKLFRHLNTIRYRFIELVSQLFRIVTRFNDLLLFSDSDSEKIDHESNLFRFNSRQQLVILGIYFFHWNWASRIPKLIASRCKFYHINQQLYGKWIFIYFSVLQITRWKFASWRYERVRYTRFMNIYNLFHAQYKLQNGCTREGFKSFALIDYLSTQSYRIRWLNKASFASVLTTLSRL